MSAPRRIAVAPETAIVVAVLVLSVLPIAVTGTIPGFQQDWYWPSDRAFVWTWLSDWIGQWSSKGLGQPNLLPMETPIVLIQAALIYVFGPSTGLAAYLLLCALTAAFGIAALLKRLQLASPLASAACGIFYAIGPVFFIRVQAGHLAYIAAYALLPRILAFVFDINGGAYRRWMPLSILCALAYSQIQFIAYIPAALFLWGVVYCRRWKTAGYIVLAVAVGGVLQLQGIAPLLMSGSRSFYLAEKPLRDWLVNLSAAPVPAIGGLGYFVPYYENAALPFATVVLVALPIMSAIVGAIRFRRLWVLAALLVAFGWLVSAGVRGPLGGAFAWSFDVFTPLDVLRDFHYAAVFTELGGALFIALAFNAVPLLRYLLIPAVIYAVAPSFIGVGLLHAGVPHAFLSRMKAEAAFMSAHGNGPVLWVPAEGPLALGPDKTKGRDPAMYTYANVPFVGDSRDLRIVSQIDNSLHAGIVPTGLLRRAGIRYIVTRPGLTSSRTDTLGTSRPLGFAGKTIPQIAVLLKSAHGIAPLARFGADQVFEVNNPWPQISVHPAIVGPLLFSQLPSNAVTALPAGVKPLPLQATRTSPDPMHGWQSPYVGAWFNPWLNDAIYPYVFTRSSSTLYVDTHIACVMIAGVSGNWSRHVYRGSLIVQPHGMIAITGLQQPCADAETGTVIVGLSSFDPSWIARTSTGLKGPLLVDGWAMGWRSSTQPLALVYLPSLVQAASVALDLILLTFLLRGKKIYHREMPMWNRERD